MSYYTRCYLLRRWLARYLRLSDLLGLLMAFVGVTLAVLAYVTDSRNAVLFGLAFVGLFLWRTTMVILQRRAKDSVQGQVFRRICSQIDTDILHSRLGARITLFTPDPLRRSHITARYRYDRANPNPIRSASNSRARYRLGEGHTGAAWKVPSALFLAILPKFDSRAQFEEYYTDRVKIEKDTVHELSDYMVQVRAILSYGLEDSAGRFLGVISVDFKEPVIAKDDQGASIVFLENVLEEDDVSEFDALQIHEILRSLQWIFEAFAEA